MYYEDMLPTKYIVIFKRILIATQYFKGVPRGAVYVSGFENLILMLTVFLRKIATAKFQFLPTRSMRGK